MSCSQFDFNCRNCLTVTTGFDYRVQFSYTDNEGNPIDLTGLGIFMDLKNEPDDVGYVLRLQKTSDPLVSGLYVDDPTTGNFTLYLRAEETESLGEGTRLYNLYTSADLLSDYSNFATASKDLISYGNISFQEGAF